MMNGIGGSGDFTRNSLPLDLHVAPRSAKGGQDLHGRADGPHVDHNEHSVQVIVTEQGLADLRGLGPCSARDVIIDNCAHPAYRDYLHRYLAKRARATSATTWRCFELHRNLMEQGSMLPGQA